MGYAELPAKALGTADVDWDGQHQPFLPLFGRVSGAVLLSHPEFKPVCGPRGRDIARSGWQKRQDVATMWQRCGNDVARDWHGWRQKRHRSMGGPPHSPRLCHRAWGCRQDAPGLIAAVGGCSGASGVRWPEVDGTKLPYLVCDVKRGW